MKLLDLSNNIWSNELLESDDTSIPKIQIYLQANIGALNNLLGTKFMVSGNDVSPEMTDDQAAIFAVMYLVQYLPSSIQ